MELTLVFILKRSLKLKQDLKISNSFEKGNVIRRIFEWFFRFSTLLDNFSLNLVGAFLSLCAIKLPTSPKCLSQREMKKTFQLKTQNPSNPITSFVKPYNVPFISHLTIDFCQILCSCYFLSFKLFLCLSHCFYSVSLHKSNKEVKS